MRLVSQVQEFVIEVKIRLFAFLHERSVNLAEIILSGQYCFSETNFEISLIKCKIFRDIKFIWVFYNIGLLDDYDVLVSTAILISELVKPLKKCLNFNLTWDCFIKKLYQIYVYNDALVQHNLPIFIGQVRYYMLLKKCSMAFAT